jgi:hypothetical protein
VTPTVRGYLELRFGLRSSNLARRPLLARFLELLFCRGQHFASRGDRRFAFYDSGFDVAASEHQRLEPLDDCYLALAKSLDERPRIGRFSRGTLMLPANRC